MSRGKNKKKPSIEEMAILAEIANMRIMLQNKKAVNLEIIKSRKIFKN